MRNDGQGLEPLDVDVYLQTQAQLRELKSQLPQNSVESLAREVIRRLAERDVDAVDAPSGAQIEVLCLALLSGDDSAGARFIQEVRTEGASVEVVYLKYLASAARLLGEWWDEDRVSFVDVTLGTSRMYAIMRAMRHQFSIGHVLPTRSAVFVSVPGETHTLGVRMAADLFRKEGWDIELMTGRTHDELVAEVAQSKTQIIGISAAGAHSVKPLSQLVIALRISNPGASIIVSGNVLEKEEETVGLMGVDGMTNDIAVAKDLLATFWNQRP